MKNLITLSVAALMVGCAATPAIESNVMPLSANLLNSCELLKIGRATVNVNDLFEGGDLLVNVSAAQNDARIKNHIGKKYGALYPTSDTVAVGEPNSEGLGFMEYTVNVPFAVYKCY